ncbi:MAG: hypothetical protein U0359_21860 [Byssovorax sp.]
MARTILGTVIVLSFVALPALAADPPPHVSAQLSYTSARGMDCPAEPVLHAEVARHLGYDPFAPKAKTRLTVTVKASAHTLIAQLAAFDDKNTQVWSKPPMRYPEGECAALFAGLGTAIAFYLDPFHLSVQTPSTPPPAIPEKPLPQAPLPPSPTEDKIEHTATPKAPYRHVEVGLGPQLAVGTPGPSFSAFAHVGARWPIDGERIETSIGIEVRYDAPRALGADVPVPGASITSFAIGGTLAPCLHVFRRFLGCALLSGGAVSGEIAGVDRPHSLREGYFGAGPRLAFEERFLPWLGVRLHADALIMARTKTGTIDGVPAPMPALLASRVNGAAGASLMTYF